MAKKSKHPGRIPAEKIEAVYLDWVDGMSMDKLHKKYSISARTIAKYRDDQNWVERKSKIQSVVAKKLDTVASKRTARYVSMYQLAQKAGVANLQDEDGNIVKMAPSVALSAIDMGIKGEREILGDVDEAITLTLRIPKGITFGDRPPQHSSDN